MGAEGTKVNSIQQASVTTTEGQAGSVRDCIPSDHEGQADPAGFCDARRAIRRDRVTNYPDRIEARQARCQGGDSYSCGARTALEGELATRHRAAVDASRLRPGDRAVRVDDDPGMLRIPDYDRGIVVTDSKNRCKPGAIAFLPDMYKIEGTYECVWPSTLRSGTK